MKLNEGGADGDVEMSLLVIKNDYGKKEHMTVYSIL